MGSTQVFYAGNVQGVGFRYTIKQLAKGFDVTGWVRNLSDGRVELRASGAPDELAALYGNALPFASVVADRRPQK